MTDLPPQVKPGPARKLSNKQIQQLHERVAAIHFDTCIAAGRRLARELRSKQLGALADRLALILDLLHRTRRDGGSK
jgi:hypothetical protein